MTDPRYTQLAEILIRYSCELEPGDKVLIESIDAPPAFVQELVRVAAEAGAQPLVTLKSQAVQRSLLMNATEEQMQLMADTEALRMAGVDAYIGVRGGQNVVRAVRRALGAHGIV